MGQTGNNAGVYQLYQKYADVIGKYQVKIIDKIKHCLQPKPLIIVIFIEEMKLKLGMQCRI